MSRWRPWEDPPKRTTGQAEQRHPALQWFSNHCVTTAEQLRTRPPCLAIDAGGHSPGDVPEKSGETYIIPETLYDSLRAVVSITDKHDMRGWMAGRDDRHRFLEDCIRLSFESKHPGAHSFLYATVEYFAKEIGADVVRLSFDDLAATVHWFVKQDSRGNKRDLSVRGDDDAVEFLLQQYNVAEEVDETGENDRTEMIDEAIGSYMEDNTDERVIFPIGQLFLLPTDKQESTSSSDSRPLIIHVPHVLSFSKTNTSSDTTLLIQRILRYLDAWGGRILVIGTDSENSCPCSSCIGNGTCQCLHSRHGIGHRLRFGAHHPPLSIRVVPVAEESQNILLKRAAQGLVEEQNIQRLKSLIRFGSSMISVHTLPHSTWNFSKTQAREILGRELLDLETLERIARLARGTFDLARIERAIVGLDTIPVLFDEWQKQDGAQTWNDAPDHVSKVVKQITDDEVLYEFERALLGCIVNPNSITETWRDISLEAETKSRVKHLLDFNIQPKTLGSRLLQNSGPNQLLVYGPQGTGKTQLARVLARESKATMIHVSAADIEHANVGNTEKTIKALFNLARMLGNSIIFIDEADSLFLSRSQSCKSWECTRVTQLLQEMDGLLQKERQPFVILATNHPERLDHAVLRRVMSRLYLGIPSQSIRHQILLNLLRDEKIGSDLNLTDLAARTRWYTGSDLRSLCVQAAQFSAEDRLKSSHPRAEEGLVIESSHFEKAFQTIHPSMVERNFARLKTFAHNFDPPSETVIDADQIAFSQINTKSPVVAKVPATLRQKDHGGNAKSDSETLKSTPTIFDSEGGRCLSPATSLGMRSNEGDIQIGEDRNQSETAGAYSSRVGGSVGDDSDCFTYQPLQPQSRDIRLLEVLSDGAKGDAIHCALHHVSMTDAIAYTALSYVWGSSDKTENMLIGGASIPITASLAYALRWVRYHWQQAFPERNLKDFRLWVDAVCINQDDLSERNHQVSLMREIYSQAELVLSSLATADERVSLALRVYNEIYEVLTKAEPEVSRLEITNRTWLKRIPALCSVDADVDTFPRNKAWQALHWLGEIPYWERVWIIQETVLAQVLVIFCGKESSKFTEICEIPMILQAGKARSTRWLEELRIPDGMKHDAWCPHCYRQLTESASGFRMTAKLRHGFRTTPLDTAELSRLARTCDATDPKDCVYGVMGLSTLDLTIDYNKPTIEVYIDFIRAYLRRPEISCGCRSKQLDFLMYSGVSRRALVSTTTWPSWLPDYSAKTQLWLDVRASSEQYSEDVIATDHSAQIRNESLLIAGARIELITEAAELGPQDVKGLENFNLDEHALDVVKHLITRDIPLAGELPVLQALIRTFMANSEPLSSNMVTSSFGIFLRWVRASHIDHSWESFLVAFSTDLEVPFDDTKATDLIDWFLDNFCPGHAHLGNHYEMKEVFHVVLGSSHGQTSEADVDYVDHWKGTLDLVNESFDLKAREGSVILETAGHFLGLGPRQTTAGDFVCILEGSRYPAVLRQVDGHFIFVGLCFINALDEDELRKRLDMGSMEVERFDIR